MRYRFFYILIPSLIIVLIIVGMIIGRNKNSNPNPTPSASISAIPTLTPSPTSTQTLDIPIAEFKNRITKKPFGIFVSPGNSPISPERFTGYHTGADVEYTDVTTDVPVFAIADGRVVLSKTASGYGGVFMIEINLNAKPHTILYGHIRPSSLPPVGMKFNKGDQLGLLGTGFSSETDGERRHLHFAVLSDNRIDIRGYVQSKSELSGWIDPLTLY